MKCDAVILAAGKGTRMFPFTDTQAKPAIDLLDRPLLHYVLDFLRYNGVKKVCVVVGYRSDDVVSAAESYGAEEPPVHPVLPEWTSEPVKFRFVHQDAPLGTGSALLAAERFVSDDFIVVNGDLLITAPVLVKERSILVVRREHGGEYGTPVFKDGVLVGIREKQPGTFVNGGVYRVTGDIFQWLHGLKPSPRGEYEITDALPHLKLRPVCVSPKDWLDVGRPWDILTAARRLLAHVPSEIRGDVQDGAHIHGAVYVARGATVRSGAYIVGPVYIGPGATVGPNAYVRQNTVISADARVGNAVEIKASVLQRGAHVSHLSYVGDSVLGPHVNFGAGTITANLRFDDKPVLGVSRKLGAFVGENVKTGVHVSIMPGVRVGADAWIFPQSVVYSDVPRGARVGGIYRGCAH